MIQRLAPKLQSSGRDVNKGKASTAEKLYTVLSPYQ